MNSKIFKINTVSITCIILVYLLLFSCDSLNDPGEAELKNSVLFNLTVNASKQQMFIYRIADLSEQANYQGASFENNRKFFNNFFVKDAEVLLQNEQMNSIVFEIYTDSSDELYFTNSEALDIKPNEKYFLSGISDGQSFSGETVIPDDFNILAPRNGEVFSNNRAKDVNIIWTKSQNAGGYHININIPYTSNDGVERQQIRDFFTSDTTFLYRSIGGYVISNIDSVIISVSACDKNIDDHINNAFDSAGLKGAYGYFGSSVLKSVKVFVEY